VERLKPVFAMRVTDGCIMHHGIISSCQSAVTFEIEMHCCSSLLM